MIYFDSELLTMLLSCRWNVAMPAIVAKSIAILSDAGLGMAMFSLGVFHSIFLNHHLAGYWYAKRVYMSFYRFVHGVAAKNYRLW